jgi:hypothetical protein
MVVCGAHRFIAVKNYNFPAKKSKSKFKRASFVCSLSFILQQMNYYYSNGAYSFERLRSQASSQRQVEAGETKGQGCRSLPDSGTLKVNTTTLTI